MADVTDLDETAQRLRVSWRKANNYFASLASVLFDTKKQFDAGMYPGWTFETWLLRKAGLSEPYVMQQLKVFQRVISAEAREKVERATIEIAARKRAEKQAVAAERRVALEERRAAAANRRADAEEKLREQEALRRAREAEAAAAKRKAPKHPKRHEYWNKHKADKRIKLAEAGPENVVLQRLIAEAAAIEKPVRSELGRVYLAMKTIVENKQAGRDANGHPWTWTGWVRSYLNRSRKDVWRCIEEYQALVASCHNEQDENVVQFQKNIA